MGVLNQFGEKRENLQELLLFYSSTEKKLVTLREYVDRMPEGQKYIYYAAGDTVEAIDSLPQTELLKDRSMEILYCTDRADEFWRTVCGSMTARSSAPPWTASWGWRTPQDPGERQRPRVPRLHQGDAGRPRGRGEGLRQAQDPPRVHDQRRGLTFEMEKYFKAVQPELQMKAKRILEVNVAHPAFLKLESVRVTDPELAKKYAEVLYNQALLIAGLPIADPSGYTDLVCSLWS